MNNNSDEEDIETQRLKDICLNLGEHYDTVQIFVTRHEPIKGGTINADWGTGNWFARKGQITEWVNRQDEINREATRQRQQQ